MSKSRPRWDPHADSMPESVVMDSQAEGAIEKELVKWVGLLRSQILPQERRSTLKELLIAVRDKKTPQATAAKAIRLTHTSRDLEEVLKETRWLLRNRINFNVR